MNIAIKDKTGLEIKSKSATLKLEWFDNNHENELKALAILLGGYNQYGRRIDLEKHRERMIIFNDLIDEIANEL